MRSRIASATASRESVRKRSPQPDDANSANSSRRVTGSETSRRISGRRASSNSTHAGIAGSMPATNSSRNLAARRGEAPPVLTATLIGPTRPTAGRVKLPRSGMAASQTRRPRAEQSAHFVEEMKANPNERLTFYGMEKNPTTIRLAKMNLAST